jgi:histidinol-phosphate/aromatic aminotransferase/cobyric acid decarboxylase-like protein
MQDTHTEVLANVRLTEREQAILRELRAIKDESGSHSPSLYTLKDRVPDLAIKVDACFLSNPYATDLFIERLTDDLLATGELRKVLEFYPSQNRHVAALLQPVLGVDADHIFVCNGAVEAIQAALHRFAGMKVAVILPTFSPYYEYLLPNQEVLFYRLSREHDFELDVDEFIEFVLRNGIDTVCLINPNNPDGGYVPTARMREMLDAFADLQLVILDESFVDFAYEDEQRTRQSLAVDAAQRSNVMLIKSMSKDFGIAGIRAGYAITSPPRVEGLVKNGYLWNISGLTEFFFRLFAEEEFQQDYVEARLRYLDEATRFFAALAEISHLHPYPTKANFCLVELATALPVEILAPLLLIRYGVYIRDCRDKIGLEDGQYVRIAGRTEHENEMMVTALREAIAECAGRA